MHQGGSGGAAGCGSALYDGGAGADAAWGVADECFSHAGATAVLRRDLFSSPGHAGPTGFSDHFERN